MVGIIRACLSKRLGAPMCYQQHFWKNVWKEKCCILLKSSERCPRKVNVIFSCMFHCNANVSRNVNHNIYLSSRFINQRKLKWNQFRTLFTTRQLLQRGRKNKISFFHNDTALYITSILICMVGLAYAAVPLYRLFCQATGLGGDPRLASKFDLVKTMEPVRERKINVFFNADHHAAMQWNFKPAQKEITVVPGETALAFYTAKNPTDEPIVGVATYNVLPFQAGLYFNKIQCFCFEEQWLNPHEEVDMPVFFYIDPDYDDDPILADVDDIVLSYTFFKAEKGKPIPLPGFMRNQNLSPNTESNQQLIA